MNPAQRIAAIAAISVLSPVAQSQSFPSKPLRIVVPTQGTSVDHFPRVLTPKLSEGFGQSVIVEIRTGGSGIPGTDYVAKSAPDGYPRHAKAPLCPNHRAENAPSAPCSLPASADLN